MIGELVMEAANEAVLDACFVRAGKIEDNVEGDGFARIVNIETVHLGDFGIIGNCRFDNGADFTVFWRIGIFGIDANSENDAEFGEDAFADIAGELVEFFCGHRIWNLDADGADDLERAVIVKHEIIDAADVRKF